MKNPKFLWAAALALTLLGCGGGGDSGPTGNPPTPTPPKPAEVVVSTATWITHGSLYYKCPDNSGPCRVGFPVNVTVTEAGAHTDVEFYAVGSNVAFRKDIVTSPGSEHTFQVEPVEVQAGAAINVRLVSTSANGRLLIPSFQSFTGGVLLAPDIKRVTPAEIVDDTQSKGTKKFQLKCPADMDPCRLASFMLTLNNVVPGTVNYVRAYRAGSDILLEEQSFTTAGTTSSEKIFTNVNVPQGTTVEYRVTSSPNANISLSYRVVLIGDKMLRPIFRTDPGL